MDIDPVGDSGVEVNSLALSGTERDTCWMFLYIYIYIYTYIYKYKHPIYIYINITGVSLGCLYIYIYKHPTGVSLGSLTCHAVIQLDYVCCCLYIGYC